MNGVPRHSVRSHHTRNREEQAVQIGLFDGGRESGLKVLRVVTDVVNVCNNVGRETRIFGTFRCTIIYRKDDEWVLGMATHF